MKEWRPFRPQDGKLVCFGPPTVWKSTQLLVTMVVSTYLVFLSVVNSALRYSAAPAGLIKGQQDENVLLGSSEQGHALQGDIGRLQGYTQRVRMSLNTVFVRN